jgi:hypothetical protein
MYVLSSEAQIVSRSVWHGWWLNSKQKKSKIASGPVRTGPVWILPVPNGVILVNLIFPIVQWDK